MAEGRSRLPILPSCLYHSSPSLLKDCWAEYRILCWCFLSPFTRNFSLHSLLAFIVSEENWMLLSLSCIGIIFFNSGFFEDHFFCLQFFAVWIWYAQVCFDNILLGVLWFFWIFGLLSYINMGKFSVIIVSNIASVPFSVSSPSGIPIMYMIHLLFSCLTILGNAVLFSSLFFSAFQFWRFPLTYPQAQRCFHQLCAVY